MRRVRYFLRRVVLSVPVLWLGMSVTFFVIYLGPVDPAAAVAESTANRQASYRRARRQLGLDEPVHEQYLDFLVDMLTFDLGQSWIVNPGVDTWQLIGVHAPRTLWLGAWSVLIAISVGVPLGFYAGLHPNTVPDYLASLLGIVWRAMPNFWLAIVLLSLLSQSEAYLFGFDWSSFHVEVPLTGAPSLSNLHRPSNLAAAIKKILPAAFVLGSASMGNELRIVRTAVLETINERYVDVARAKGVPRWRLVGKHVLRNALVPLVPVITSEAFLLLGGSVLVERVFGINGMGSLFVEATLNADLPLVASLMYLFIVLLLAINLLQDLLYTIVDPRVGFEGANA